MRKEPNLRIEPFRREHGVLGAGDGNYGYFEIPTRDAGRVEMLRVISAGALYDGWEHVSASLVNRCPLWSEMCRIKRLFWHDDEVVMQLHPAERDWISVHPYTLHLWRPLRAEIPLPPKENIG